MKNKIYLAATALSLLVSCSKEKNYLTPATLEVQVISENTTFQNVKLRLSEKNEVETAITDNSGKAQFNQVNYGSYKVSADSVKIGRFKYHISKGVQMSGEDKTILINPKDFVFSAELTFATKSYGTDYRLFINKQILIIPEDKYYDAINKPYPTKDNLIDTLIRDRAIMSGTTDDQGRVKFSGIPIAESYAIVSVDKSSATYYYFAEINAYNSGYVLRQKYYIDNISQ